MSTAFSSAALADMPRVTVWSKASWRGFLSAGIFILHSPLKCHAGATPAGEVGRKSTAGTGPIEDMPRPTTTFRTLLDASRPAGRGFAPIDASRGDDERVFDSLHRAG